MSARAETIVYEDEPPSWLPEAHASLNLGHPGFDPLLPGEEEENLSKANAKDGYIIPSFPAETVSAQPLIHTMDTDMDDLSSLLNQVLGHRAASSAPIPAPTFRMPARVTFTEAKRHAWFADLAREDVPLHKLGRNVPHGTRGAELLALLHTHAVPPDRATWLVRIIGANESVARSSGSPSAYSVEWAVVVTAQLKKILAEIVLPASTQRLGPGIKSTFRGILSEPDSRARWTARFTYFSDLLRLSYTEGLVDRRTFMLWLARELGAANLAQAPFLADLTHEYLSDALTTRSLAHLLASACILRLVEIKTQDAPELDFLAESLIDILHRTCITLPDALVNSRLWFGHDEAITEIFASPVTGSLDDDLVWKIPQAADVDVRVRGLLFLDEPPAPRSRLSVAVSTVHTLNAVTVNQDWTVLTTALFAEDMDDMFEAAVFALLGWATCAGQYGLHRVYITARVLAHTGRDLQNVLFSWLDNSSFETSEADAVAILMGHFIRDGLFEYTSYLHRLLVRDERGLSFGSEEQPSRHRSLLRDIPLVEGPLAVLTQRKMILYGLRSRDTPDEMSERAVREQLRCLLDGEPSLITGDLEDMRSACPALFSARPYERVRTLEVWLAPLVQKRLQLGQLTQECFVMCIFLFENFGCLKSLFDMTMSLIRIYGGDIIELALAILQPHLLVWASLGVLDHVIQTVLAVHASLKERRTYSRPVFTFLVRPAVFGLLGVQDQEMILADRNMFRSGLAVGATLCLASPSPVDTRVSPQSAMDATGLSLRNEIWLDRTGTEWMYKPWDSMLRALCSVANPEVSSDDQIGRALQEAEVLVQVSLQLPEGLNLAPWLVRAEASIPAEAWMMFVVVVVHLCSRGALVVTDVLDTLVYPNLADTEAASRGAFEAACTLLRTLVIHANSRHAYVHLGVNPLLQNVYLRANREEMFEDGHFVALLQGMQSLKHLRDKDSFYTSHRTLASEVLSDIIGTPRFRQAVFQTIGRDFQGEPLDDEHPDSSAAQALRRHVDVLSTLIPGEHAGAKLTWLYALELFLVSADSGDEEDSRLLRNLISTALQDGDVAGLLSEHADMLPPAGIQKFVEAGVRELAPTLIMTDADGHMSRASDLLRLLSALVSSLRLRAMAPPGVSFATQDTLFPSLNLAISAVVERISVHDVSRPIDDSVTHRAIFLARVLQFDLGLHDIWSSTTCSTASTIGGNLFTLIIFYARSIFIDITPFALLLDTLYFLVDEATSGSKTTDPFQFYPSLALSELPADISQDRLQKIRQLMPFPDPHPDVRNLAFIHEQGGSLQPLQNRPWEWTEYIGDAGDDEPLSIRHLVKNTASLSLELFDTSGTGERLPVSRGSAEFGALQTFEDSLASMTIYEQSGFIGRVEPVNVTALHLPAVPSAPTHEAPAWAPSMMNLPYTPTHPNSRGTSPASSAPGRSPYVHSAGARVSPRAGSIGTPQGAATGARRGNKRKAMEALEVDDDDEDDIEIVDEPPAASATTASAQARPKPRPVGKAKSQMR